MKHKFASKFVVLSVLLALMFSAIGTAPAQAVDAAPWDTNLVINPGAETGDHSGWSGNTGSWAISADSHQGSRSFITTHSWITRYQEIDLLAAGFTAGDLDSAPTVMVGEWFKGFNCGGGCNPADQYYFKVELRNAAQMPIASWNVGTQASPVTATATWTEQTHTFSSYGSGLRYIYLEDGGKDIEGWSGFYGTIMDDAYAMLLTGNPIATTDTANSITLSGATLNGMVNANGNSTTVTFEYGLDTSYGNTATADQSPLTGSTYTAVSAAITGLTPTATYHFRVKAVNSIGTTYGRDQILITSHVAGIRYVKPVASGTGDCSSWEHACALQTELTTALSGDEVWVMQGTYRPTSGSDRIATFQLVNGVEMYGGFFGDETQRSDRHGGASILSGDLLGNDSGFSNNGENSIHVVTGVTGATLDGFTVTGGNADLPSTYSNGGGMYNEYASPIVRNVTFSGNSASYGGGGMYNSNSSPTVTNVTFSGNSAPYGGGMHNYINGSTITNVTFSGNSATQGGGMYINGPGPTVKNVIIANSIGGGDCVGSLNAASANNLIESTGSYACSLVNGANDNIIGSDPLLGALGNYGGSTSTLPLLSSSPAIDAGDDAVCAAEPVNNLDQRGVTRPQGAHCDIGAYEARLYALTITSAHGTVAKNPDQATYPEYGMVQLTATPEPGWNFVNWSGDLTSSDNPASITIQGNTSVTANYTLMASPSIITETFNNATAPGWTLLGNAVLTENTIDAGGNADGWLRVTDASAGQVGGAIYDTPVPTSASFEVQFDYAAYGGTGADGIAFYMINSESSGPALGNAGGSLGYKGVGDGYLGIGFSEYWVNHGVSILGPGNLDSGFETLTSAAYYPMSVDRAGAHHVRIAFFDKHISVWINGTPVITNFDVSSQIAPDTVKFGLSGATGEQTNIHEIKNFGMSIQPPLLSVNPTNWDFGNLVVGTTSDAKTFTITNSGYSDLELGAFSTSGDFNLLNDSSCNGQTIPAGGTCTFDVTFSPISGGIHTSSVSIPSNALSSVDAVALSGRACTSNAITVTSNTNSGPGSLRQAITDICPGGTITFNNNYTITLESQLVIDKDMTINGGAHAVTVSGNNAVRVFFVNTDVAFDLQNLTVANGYTADSGGGIYNDGGALTLTNVTLSDNNSDYDGGGIETYGTLTVTNCTFSGNSTSGVGGGIDNRETLTITGGTFSENSAANGGAVFNDGTLAITNSTFSGNSALFNESLGYGGGGGGIASISGTLDVMNSTFTNNNADMAGGGIVAQYDITSVINSTLSGNTVAGVDEYNGGGAIAQFYGDLILINSTVTGNTAASPNQAKSGVWLIGDVTSGTLTLSNSIVANNNGGNNFQNDDGTFTSQGHNLSDNWNGLIIDPSDLTANPLLGELTNNGGPTQTIPLLPGSPAIDAGNDTICADPDAVNNLDQRGVTRPQGAHCDIGAFEARLYTLTITSAHGTVAKNPDQAIYPESSVVQLTATPATGWSFANWTGDLAGNTNPGSVTIHGNTSVTANYMLDNQEPTNIILSNNSVLENLSIGAAVGTLTTADLDPGDTHTYSFCGGADDGFFSLAGNTLHTAAVFDFEAKSSYSICIRTDDGNGGTFNKAFTITITDVDDDPVFKIFLPLTLR